ncbi:unnamed protein product, partial [Mesorhabditis belari]|uniref:protein-tyrosine-phosphatase n=1 Tax=Mesorhabditis belari TaxID=2138241 RepID=A0AAF3J2R0_9BILA
MRRKPPKWSANWGISLIVFFSTVIIDVNANDVFSSYQDYIKQLAYPARLVVRPDASVVVTSSPVSFFCRSDGNPLPTVVWKVNGKSITDSRFTVKSLQSGLSTLRIEPVIPSDNQSLISCSADNGVASPVFAEALLTVFEKESTPTGFPSIDSHPSLKSVEQGRTAHVNCRVHGAPRPKVLWLRDLIPVDIRADARYSVSTIGNPGALMIQNAREEDQGKYECVARNEHGVMHSKSAHLYVKVRRVPPYFSYKLEKLYKVHIGGNLNLTCVAVGYPMPRVFWKKSGDVALSDPLTAPIGKNILTLSAVEKSENFTCVAVSKLGNIEAITTVMAKPSPPSPSLLRVDGVTSSSVTLAWDHVKLPENERLIKYLIKFRQKYGDSSHFRVKEISAELQRATIGDLEPFTLYEFTISTVNEIGSGNPSPPREAQTAEAAPSTPPRKVQARAMNRGSIYVTWEPSEHPNGEISGYRILYTDGDKNTPTAHWESKDVTGQPPSQIHGLKLDAIYHIYVQARNRKGVSPLSNLATVITTQGIPGQPQSLTAKASDSRGIQLTWEQPLLVQPILRYVVWMNGTEGERELTLTNAQEKYSVTGLDPNIYYAFRVAAESQRGRGPFCPTVVAQTLPSAPAGPPTITAMSSENSSSIEISWSPPDQIHQNGKIVNYQLKWRSIETIKREKNDEESEESNEIEKKNEEKWEVMRVDGMSGKSTVIGLIPATVYEVTIAAGTEKGFGPESHRRTIRTKEDFEGETVSPGG